MKWLMRHISVFIAIAEAIVIVIAFWPPSSPPKPKEHYMLIGIYQPNSPGSYGDITAFSNAAGFTPRITSYYTSSFSMPFATAFANQAAVGGTRVLVQWQPRGTTNLAIATGQEDAAIVAAAQAIKTVNSQVIISYGQEMNGNWYPWGDYPGNTASDYVAAYRHIWAIFQQQGVQNVTWLWDPNIVYEGSSPLQSWYPGDQYVDWVGLDGYYAQPTETFDTLFGPSINTLRSFTYKPLLIAEVGAAGSTAPAQIADTFSGASLAGAIGIVYFDEAQSGDTEHQDWRLEDSPASMSAFSAAVKLYADRPLT